jgi:hypothetical protein
MSFLFKSKKSVSGRERKERRLGVSAGGERRAGREGPHSADGQGCGQGRAAAREALKAGQNADLRRAADELPGRGRC